MVLIILYLVAIYALACVKKRIFNLLIIKNIKNG